MSGDRYVGSSYDPKNVNNMCTALLVAKNQSKLPIIPTKSGNAWSLKVDCDGDGNFTSYLTDVASDVLQKKSSQANKTWTSHCTGGQCTFQSTKNKKYLALNGSALSVATNPVQWTLATS